MESKLTAGVVVVLRSETLMHLYFDIQVATSLQEYNYRPLPIKRCALDTTSRPLPILKPTSRKKEAQQFRIKSFPEILL
ncbi:hypothetical protein ACLB2K_055121 [Fragaria x ananassa]